MRYPFVLLSAIFLFSTGCEQPAPQPQPTAPVTPPAVTKTDTSEPVTSPAPPAETSLQSPVDVVAPTAGPQIGASAPSSTAPAPPAGPVPDGFTPVRVENGVVKLNSENTTIQIIGRHAAPRGGPNDPMARTIVCMKFDGQMEIDPATKLPKSANAEIDATSLTAFAANLTSHLKNPDFIDVEKYPTIKFASTRIEPTGEAGQVKIVGNLTLKDVTKEITVPAKITSDASGLTLLGEVQLNRREFNINASAIDGTTMPEIDLTLAVGKKTAAPGGGGRRRGG
jgi:polyisoprenoid-binding protein YceI